MRISDWSSDVCSSDLGRQWIASLDLFPTLLFWFPRRGFMNKINNEQDLLAFGCAVSSLKGIPGLSKFESPINLMSPVSDETEIGAYTYVGPAGEIGGAKIGRFCSIAPRVDRKSVVSGKSVSVRVDL